MRLEPFLTAFLLVFLVSVFFAHSFVVAEYIVKLGLIGLTSVLVVGAAYFTKVGIEDSFSHLRQIYRRDGGKALLKEAGLYVLAAPFVFLLALYFEALSHTFFVQ